MTTIPSNLARVPNLLSSRLMLSSITRSSTDLLDLQVKMASGKDINRPSDDAIGTSAVSVLDDIIERRDQRLRNLSHADSVLNNVDAALGDVSGILLEAKSIASSQIGVGSDEQTRENQAKIIDAMLSQLIGIGNRQYQQMYFFGGNATDVPPIVSVQNGLRYQGEGDGLVTDVGLSRDLPITVSGADAFGALSARVEGNRDLDPTMTLNTRLVDLNGARGLGISLGSIDVDVNGTDLSVDLTDAHTVGDVIDTLETAIQTVDAGAVVQIDAATGNRLEIIPTLGPITISDPEVDATAADLGLNTTFPMGGGTGSDIDPKLTEHTLITSLTGVTAPLGTIRLSNLGQSRDLDLSGATTIEDLANLVEGLDLGIRVEIAETGDRLSFINELSGGEMSIAEVAGGSTATELGVRSFTYDTSLDDFNDGLGVQIRSGSVDPETGLPDPAADEDIRISTHDGTVFAVDFAGAETVQDILDAINAASGGAVTADLALDGNGIRLTDHTVGANDFAVTRLNGSFAGEDLGILGSTPGATLVGEDRATVAVDSVFAHLMALRDALEGNDERGIMLAGEKLEADVSRVAETRAEVGVRSRRVTDATGREEDLRIQDMGLKSEIQDLDFTEAALRFSVLQQQLQAGLTTASQISYLSLLDFLR
ncbi:MAG: flagellin [Planctomycetota bacterium]|nr:flagellin [Planctomycetota bacterium]